MFPPGLGPGQPCLGLVREPSIPQPLRGHLPPGCLLADPTLTRLCPDLQTLRVALAVLGKGCFGVSLTCLTVYRAELFPTPLR
jgi:hypothetical protein